MVLLVSGGGGYHLSKDVQEAMSRYGKQHKEETRSRILAETRRLLITEGADAVTIAPLMAKLTLTHGGFYAHFQSREDLIETAAGELCERASDAFLALVGRMEPIDAIQAYVTRYLSAEHRDAEYVACPVAALVGSVSRLGERAKRAYQRSYQSLLGSIANSLNQAGVAEAKDEAASILAELVGAINIARALGRGKLSAESLHRSRAALVKRLERMRVDRTEADRSR